MQVNRKISIAIEQYLIQGIIIVFMVLLYAPLLIHWYDGWLNKNIGIDRVLFSMSKIQRGFAGFGSD